MKKIFKSIIVISIIFLSFLIVCWNFDSEVIGFNNEMNNNPSSRSNILLNDYNFDWGPIEVISEPIVGQNNNVNDSLSLKIAIENNKIYVVWQDDTDYNGAGGDTDIFYRYFDGSKWSKIQVISEPITGKDFNIEASREPDITVENGKIYVCWFDRNNTNGAGTDGEIFYRCNLNGTNWEDIQVISEPIPGFDFNIKESDYPSIAVENGKIYVVWHDRNNTNNGGIDYDIFYRCNLTGYRWEDIQVISEPVNGQNLNSGTSTHPDIAVENNNIYVVWDDRNDTNRAGIDDDIFYRCNFTGYKWEDIQVISEPVQGKNYNIKSSIDPKIVVENNKIYVVWGDSNNTNGAGEDSDIFYRCKLNSYFWEPVQVISEPIQDKNLNTGGSAHSNIAVENSKIYVVWADSNETNYAGQDIDIFLKCNLTGYSWEPIHVISEPIAGNDFNTEWSSEPDIAVNSGKSHIVWVDENNTNSADIDWDIFYRKLNLPLILSHPSITPFVGNTSTIFSFKVKYTHLKNIPPTELIVNINSIEYSMNKIDPNDTNYTDGKDYFFNFKNLDVGLNTYQFRAFDGLFTWVTPLVNKPIVINTHPNILTEDNLTAIEDVYYEVDYKYEDIDTINIGQTGTWESSTNAEWLKFDLSTAILNGTPTNDNVGEYWVNISIDDTIDSDYTNFTLRVINVNDAPIIITNDTNIINEYKFYEVDYEALDVDTPQNNLNWFLQSNASWLEFGQKSAILSGLPENNDVGEFWINISVSDGEYIDFSNFTLKVINVNDPPKIITKEIPGAYEDNYYEMDFEAEDVDNVQNDLTWTIKTNAQWLRVDNIYSIINGTPMNEDVGEYWVNISITDGEYFDHKNLTLKVMNTNDPPKIIEPGIIKAIVDDLYSIQFEAVDIDPSPTVFTWFMQTNISNWLSIGPNTGLLIGEPSIDDIGTFWVNVSLTDGEDGWDYFNFTLKVIKGPATEKDTSDTPIISTETFYWAIWIVILIIILVSIIILLILRKQKREIIHILEKQEKEMIQTVKAELLHTTPNHILLSAETSIEGRMTLPAQPVVINQLPPKPVDQAQSATAVKIEEEPVKAIGSIPLPHQYQLPQATFSKEQQLNLLRERFSKGDLSEETYNILKSELKRSPDEDIISTKEELEASLGSTPKLVGTPLLEQPTEHRQVALQPSLTQQTSTEVQPKQAQQELSSTPKDEGHQPETQATQQHSQSSTQEQHQPIPTLKKQIEKE